MKIWYPKQYSQGDYENVQEYISKCQLDLFVLKDILNKNINLSRWNAINERLVQSQQLHIIDGRQVEAIEIAKRYVYALTCYYDTAITKCYYDVPALLKCPNTVDSLRRIIRYIEFGFDDIPPMNWIRHSYTIFTDYVLGEGLN